MTETIERIEKIIRQTEVGRCACMGKVDESRDCPDCSCLCDHKLHCMRRSKLLALITASNRRYGLELLEKFKEYQITEIEKLVGSTLKTREGTEMMLRRFIKAQVEKGDD